MLKHILHILYPGYCVACQVPLYKYEQHICISCENELPLAKTSAEMFDRLSPLMPLESAWFLLYFQKNSITQHILHDIKYHHNKHLALDMGTRMAMKIKDSGIEALIPVPLHRTKLIKRGYNQSQLFADSIAGEMGVPVLDKLLLRTSRARSQTTKSRQDRFASIDGNFTVSRQNEGVSSYKHIALVDDVVTTGATTLACFEAIRRIYFGKISVISLALSMK